MQLLRCREASRKLRTPTWDLAQAIETLPHALPIEQPERPPDQEGQLRGVTFPRES